MIALMLLAANIGCPAGQTQVYGTATENGVIVVYPKDGEDPKPVTLEKGKVWTVCLKPTLPWVHNIHDERFNPWWDEVEVIEPGHHRHEMWAVPKEGPVEASKIITDGKVK